MKKPVVIFAHVLFMCGNVRMRSGHLSCSPLPKSLTLTTTLLSKCRNRQSRPGVWFRPFRYVLDCDPMGCVLCSEFTLGLTIQRDECSCSQCLGDDAVNSCPSCGCAVCHLKIEGDKTIICDECGKCYHHYCLQELVREAACWTQPFLRWRHSVSACGCGRRDLI